MLSRELICGIIFAVEMAKCEVCKKSKKIVKSGRHRQTVNVARRGSMGLRGRKSSKKIEPNVRKVKIVVPTPKSSNPTKSSDESKKPAKSTSKQISVRMCMSCYKKYRNDESFKAKVIAGFCSA